MKLYTPTIDLSKSNSVLLLSAALILFSISIGFAEPAPFNESGGMVVVEAEHYHSKTTNGKPRDFYLFPTGSSTPTPDPDGVHTSNSGNGQYLEILPDTCVSGDCLQTNVNFFSSGSNAPQLHYNVRINSAGRYYVWARAYSTGTEDNGIHVGYDNNWPTSGTAMQWCQGKNNWTWSSARRVPENHCGVRNTIYLDLPAGDITIKFGMREDGFEFDRFILVKSNSYTPSGVGPAESNRTDGSGGGGGGGGEPDNQAPEANAGPDGSVNLSDAFALNGSASDDGLPSNNLTSQWSKVSGPGSVHIENASALETTVRFSDPGLYVLKLTVDDGELSDSDNIGIDVINDGGTTPEPDPDPDPEGDEDSDSVDDAEEDGVANNGDGNNDGIPDRLQENVTSMVTYSGEYVTLEAPAGSRLVDCSIDESPSPDDAPSGLEFTQGFFSFTITDLVNPNDVRLKVILHSDEAPSSYYKYGPTPDDPNDHWYEFIFDNNTGAEIDGNVIILHFVDADRGDDILTSDDMIVDIGGPAYETLGAQSFGPANQPGGGSSSGSCFISTLFQGVKLNDQGYRSDADQQ